MTIELPEPFAYHSPVTDMLVWRPPIATVIPWDSLYTRDQMLAFRDAALEEAALECDRLHGLRNDECADYIRALKSSKAITDSAKIRAAFENDDFQGVPV